MNRIPDRIQGKAPNLSDFKVGQLVVGAHYDPVTSRGIPTMIACPSKLDPVSGGFSRTVHIPKDEIGQVVKVNSVWRHRPIQVLFREYIVWCNTKELWILPLELFR
jgi:hypothetical protein